PMKPRGTRRRAPRGETLAPRSASDLATEPPQTRLRVASRLQGREWPHHSVSPFHRLPGVRRRRDDHVAAVARADAPGSGQWGAHENRERPWTARAPRLL